MSGTTLSTTLDTKTFKALGELIEICSKSGVKSLKLPEISVEFAQIDQFGHIVPDSYLTASHILTNNDSNNIEPSMDGALTQEDELELLKITDPAAYEEELLAE